MLSFTNQHGYQLQRLHVHCDCLVVVFGETLRENRVNLVMAERASAFVN